MNHMTGLSQMLEFLAELKQNNNRPWFALHKDEYNRIRAVCMNEVAHLISLVVSVDPEIGALTPEQSVYRIYRDIRFSNDKSPFKTYFSMVIARGGRHTNRAGYYLHLDPTGGCFLCGGIWWPETDILRRLRHDILDNMDEFVSILENPDFKASFPTLNGDTLKTMPKGFPTDCPHPEIIKMKEFLVQKNYKKSLFNSPNWEKQVVNDIILLKPFINFLNFSLE